MMQIFSIKGMLNIFLGNLALAEVESHISDHDGTVFRYKRAPGYYPQWVDSSPGAGQKLHAMNARRYTSVCKGNRAVVIRYETT